MSSTKEKEVEGPRCLVWAAQPDSATVWKTRKKKFQVTNG